MASLAKFYVDTDKPNHKIRFNIYFNKETFDWASSQPQEKGYQLIATPVKITELKDGFTMESFGAFTGFKKIIYPIGRQSPKRLEYAIELATTRLTKYLDFFRAKGIIIPKNEISQ